MGIVVPIRAGHTHALAARAVNLSELMPAERARSVDKIADHLPAGMLSRCRHLAMAGTLAEISDAKASVEGQSSITSLNELISVAMRKGLGHLVLKRKDKMTLDGKIPLGHTVHMAESETEAQFKQSFTERVKAARVATGMKQWQVAELLGIPQDKYKQYEGRSLLPHYLVGRFCILCHVDPVWLMTGRGQKPLRAPHVVDQDEEPVPKPKRAKRHRAA